MNRAIETVEKRARRAKRMQTELALVQHKWSFAGDPVDALHWVPSLTATWSGVRRLAGCAIGGWYVRDVMLACQSWVAPKVAS